mgnify:CR=1 FL=1
MSYKLYEPFLEATRNVFRLMLDISDVSDNPTDSFVCDDALDVSIGVVGDLTGEVVYHFPNATSLNMVAIMSGMKMESVDDFVTSAISEIANIISGNVLTLLSKDDLKCDILPPRLLKPDDSANFALQSASCITTSIGDVCLDIRLAPAN